MCFVFSLNVITYFRKAGNNGNSGSKILEKKGQIRNAATQMKGESEVAQSCPTLCDPVDCSLPGSSVHGIFQARVLEWIVISFSRGFSQGLNSGLLHCRQKEALIIGISSLYSSLFSEDVSKCITIYVARGRPSISEETRRPSCFIMGWGLKKLIIARITVVVV